MVDSPLRQFMINEKITFLKENMPPRDLVMFFLREHFLVLSEKQYGKIEHRMKNTTIAAIYVVRDMTFLTENQILLAFETLQEKNIFFECLIDN